MNLQINFQQKIASFLKTPVNTVALLIVLQSITASYYSEALIGTHAILTYGIAIFLHVVLNKNSSFKGGLPKPIATTIISAGILFLLLNPTTKGIEPLYGVITATVITLKHFFSYKGRQIFNPVALICAFFGTVTWWGASFHEPFGIIFAAFGCMYIGYKYRKYALIITALLTYALIFLPMGKAGVLQFDFMTGTIYFFAGVMLTDPKSSSALRNDQIISGLVAGCALALGKTMQISLVPDPFIFAILCANIVTFAINTYRMKLMKRPS